MGRMGAWWERRRIPGTRTEEDKEVGVFYLAPSAKHPPPPLLYCPKASSPAEVFSSSAGMVVTSGSVGSMEWLEVTWGPGQGVGDGERWGRARRERSHSTPLTHRATLQRAAPLKPWSVSLDKRSAG